MTAKEYVLRYFQDAYFEWVGQDAFVYANGNNWVDCIGVGAIEEEAWEDAKQWIDELPEDQKPKIK